MRKRIAILGASPDKERYANKVLHMALSKGFEPVLINPKYNEIDGFPVLSSLREAGRADYLSVYLSYPVLEKVIKDIVFWNPPEIILNPGSDTPPALELLKKHHLFYRQACTLVLLSTGQIP